MWSLEAHSRLCLTAVSDGGFLVWRMPAALCREEGMAGLWKGVGPNVARNAIINAAELASYDQVRPLLHLPGMI